MKLLLILFFFNDTATTEIYTLSLHDALPISRLPSGPAVLKFLRQSIRLRMRVKMRSEEHTSELQSQSNLVCRLLLEKKKKIKIFTPWAVYPPTQSFITKSCLNRDLSADYYKR